MVGMLYVNLLMLLVLAGAWGINTLCMYQNLVATGLDITLGYLSFYQNSFYYTYILHFNIKKLIVLIASVFVLILHYSLFIVALEVFWQRFCLGTDKLTAYVIRKNMNFLMKLKA